MIQSRAKLGYATVTDADLPDGFHELARRITAAEDARGAARVEPPQQQVIEENNGTFHLGFRPMSAIEQSNAALSLACNLAIADLMFSAGTGLFRVMREPGQRAVSRLRHTATALGLDWPSNQSLDERARTLDPNERKDALFMLAIRRAGEGATYQPFTPGERPWHSAMAATYAHGTAPLRRLADRYVNEAALALVNGKPVPAWVSEGFPLLAPVMNRADARAAQVDGAVIELAEAVVLQPRVGQIFEGCIIDADDRGVKVQLCEEPVVTRVADGALKLGERVRLRLDEASPERRLTRFSLV
jgi:exoribonuclease R